MSIIDWLNREIELAKSHIADFDAGATIKHNGADVTGAWKAEYIKRKSDLAEILERQERQEK